MQRCISITILKEFHNSVSLQFALMGIYTYHCREIRLELKNQFQSLESGLFHGHMYSCLSLLNCIYLFRRLNSFEMAHRKSEFINYKKGRMNFRLKKKIITFVSRDECVSVYNIMYNLFMLGDYHIYSMLNRSIILL